MAAETKPTGLLLAGGQSRRMSDAFAAGRGDKGLLELSGKPMLGHVIERLAPQAGRLVINANGDPQRFASFDLPVVPDTIEGFAGPLAGILAGMRWSLANAPGATHVVSVSTDAPFLPADLVTKLQQGLATASGSIALAQSGGELHPVIGLWPVALADDLEQALRSGTRKVLAWTDRHGTVSVEFPFTQLNGRSVDPFFNANTPEELAEARHLLAG
ncbi:MAG: molybdenum cofactor guanylyltransferase MobA [Hyphomicrobium sp.]|nr:molybdenum cofactor guanylyltransferase MobA [Hyphomicrobium sp.]